MRSGDSPFRIAVPGHGEPMDRAQFDTYRGAFNTVTWIASRCFRGSGSVCNGLGRRHRPLHRRRRERAQGSTRLCGILRRPAARTRRQERGTAATAERYFLRAASAAFTSIAITRPLPAIACQECVPPSGSHSTWLGLKSCTIFLPSGSVSSSRIQSRLISSVGGWNASGSCARGMCVPRIRAHADSRIVRCAPRDPPRLNRCRCAANHRRRSATLGRFDFDADGMQFAGQQFPRMLGILDPQGLARIQVENRGSCHPARSSGTVSCRC